MSIVTSSASTQRGLTQSAFVRPSLPKFVGPEGILYDFNYGCRVRVPVDGWRVRMVDLDTFSLVFDEAVEADSIVTSRRKYFVRFELQVFDGERLVFRHAYDARGRHVLIRPSGTALGDTLAWMPAVEAFRLQEQCEVHVALPAHLQALFVKGYPEMRFVSPESADSLDEPFYATYLLGFFSPYTDRDHQPTDPRMSSLQDAAAYLLGVPCKERRPNIVVADSARPVAQRYVCIATQSTAQCKYWNNPRGWPTLIDHLKSRGYRVLCIDQHREYGADGALNTMPEGCEDFTGDRPLEERAALLRHADFFVGLSSGLSWLAWAAGTPVVMISGFTHPHTEFRTPYRVINFHACNSCFNDTTCDFDDRDFQWCPRRRDKPGRFQCSSAISPEQVIAQVERLIADHGLA
ncbi:autotransporter strand-loop-strand O-heptosyltransferase [Caballeronia sp. INSB1]|uniref:autotransporter strand-loop-strand O-heptosyltransferase n=1 Tax=Caballeronia sp. INSB1 TaxID=2921751 RepID=UPI002032885E|nr:autotransporter strand-loop-strand O-heptosyltransferase [Caballeronia sp. INSB1]